MKLQKPDNPNYAVTVTRVTTLVPLAGCDNVVGMPVNGMQAIVGKDTKIGTLVLVFPTESQVSVDFAHYNNLFRHMELNKDQGKAGYLEDNRRVKAMKFRGHVSNALVMPLESLDYIKNKSIKNTFDLVDLDEGDTFDTILGHEICRKHVTKVNAGPRIEKNKNKVFRRVDEKMLPEHYDTENYFRNKDAIKPDQEIIVTQKLHGTSIRLAHTIVKRKLNYREIVAQKLGVKVAETEFAHVYGSRRSIKDPKNPAQQHYYSEDIWTKTGAKFKESIPENFVLYGELIGYTPEGSAIQKNYTYKAADNTAELYIYRVAFINAQGLLTDLGWKQMEEFCRDRGFKVVPVLWTGKHKDFKVYKWVDGIDNNGKIHKKLHRYFEEGHAQALPLDRASPVDEGVCIRVDGLAPYVLKAKSTRFAEHESSLKTDEVVDIEEQPN